MPQGWPLWADGLGYGLMPEPGGDVIGLPGDGQVDGANLGNHQWGITSEESMVGPIDRLGLEPLLLLLRASP